MTEITHTEWTEVCPLVERYNLIAQRILRKSKALAKMAEEIRQKGYAFNAPLGVGFELHKIDAVEESPKHPKRGSRASHYRLTTEDIKLLRKMKIGDVE